MMKKRFLSLLCVLALCLGLLPVTALAADGIELYVAGQLITESGCYANQDGTWTKVEDSDGTEPANGQFSYDAATFTLTLNGAKISHNDNVCVGSGDYYYGSVIAFSQSADVSLNIVVSQGTSTITGYGGIRVVSEAGDASLSISGPGSLEVKNVSNDSGIVLIGSKNVNLGINSADVTISDVQYYGVDLAAGDECKSTATINDGNLTVSDSVVGIYFRRHYTSGPSSLTVSGNAMVDTEGSTGGIINGSPDSFQIGADGESGGIVFNGNSGTVYGNVTLQEDLEIGTDETLTIGKDASLTVPEGTTLTNDGTINVESGGKLEGTTTGQGTLKIAPTITTQPQDVEVKENETATFAVKVTGTEPLSYRWQQSTDSGQSWTDIGGATDATYITAATTTNMNGTQYRCVVSNSAGSVTSNVATLTVNKHVHTWGNPVWNWSEDGKTCTVTFTCQNDETHKETPAVTVTSAVKTPATCTETGVTTYTAIVELNGQTYTDTKEVADIPATGHRYENGKCTVCSAVDPAFADFLKVQVDGKDLDVSSYAVKEGSTVVTLKPSYLETLSVGKHTLAIVSDTGTAETEFTVVAAEKQVVDDESANDKADNDGDKESLAKTGDDSMLPITVLSILAVVSIATGMFALRRSRI